MILLNHYLRNVIIFKFNNIVAHLRGQKWRVMILLRYGFIVSNLLNQTKNLFLVARILSSSIAKNLAFFS